MPGRPRDGAAVDRVAIGEDAAADPGADGDVDEGLEPCAHRGATDRPAAALTSVSRRSAPPAPRPAETGHVGACRSPARGGEDRPHPASGAAVDGRRGQAERLEVRLGGQIDRAADRLRRRSWSGRSRPGSARRLRRHRSRSSSGCRPPRCRRSSSRELPLRRSRRGRRRPRRRAGRSPRRGRSRCPPGRRSSRWRSARRHPPRPWSRPPTISWSTISLPARERTSSARPPVAASARPTPTSVRPIRRQPRKSASA